MNALPAVLDEQWDQPAFAVYRDAFPDEFRNDRIRLEEHVRDLVSRDVKAPYLKALQGHLWLQGYESGVLKAPLFADVPSFITDAHAAGVKVIIYSSGSVAAQKLFFKHTSATPSDMSSFISGWFDTVNAGPKIDAASYENILAAEGGVDASQWLFLSDNINEVKAARAAGMQSVPVVRPGNAPLPSELDLSNQAVTSFHFN